MFCPLVPKSAFGRSGADLEFYEAYNSKLKGAVMKKFVLVSVILLLGAITYHEWSGHSMGPGLKEGHKAILQLPVSAISPPDASAFGGCEEDCAKCHTLTKEEARDALKEIVPNINVLAVQASPSRGLWEVALDSNGQKGIVYLDFSKQNVLIGRIIRIKTKEDLTRERLTEINRVDFSRIPLDNALVLGDPKALHKVVVFDDPD